MAVIRNVGGPISDKQQARKSREAGPSQESFITEVKAALSQAVVFLETVLDPR